MDPFTIRPSNGMVEIWTGYHIQYDREERYEWQKDLKRELREVLATWKIPPHETFFGYYDTTDPAVSDTENSLFTNLQKSMPAGIASLRFEHGNATPPAPPVPIDVIGGHLLLLSLRTRRAIEQVDSRPNAGAVGSGSAPTASR